jgi:hypothetical protein
VYFDEPTFDPSTTSSDIDLENWETLTVVYQKEKRPVQFHRNGQDRVLQNEIAEIIAEILDDHGETRSAAVNEIIDHLKASKQVLAIEVDQEGMSEDAWVMADCVEAYIAKNYDGIVYAPDHGFFNAKLKCIYKL